MNEKVLRILLKNYTKIGTGNGIAKVIFDDKFEDIAEEIVKLFDLPVVSVSVCVCSNPEPAEYPCYPNKQYCKNCEKEIIN